MGKAFTSLGYDLVSGGTDNHLLLVDLRSKVTPSISFKFKVVVWLKNQKSTNNQTRGTRREARKKKPDHVVPLLPQAPSLFSESDSDPFLN
jgi:hypothetical protein